MEASNNILAKSDADTAMKSDGGYAAKAGADAVNKGADIQVNSGVTANPMEVLELPEHKHPPTKP